MDIMNVRDFKTKPDPEGIGVINQKGSFYEVHSIRDDNSNPVFYYNVENGKMREGNFGYTKYEDGEKVFVKIPNDATIVRDGKDIFICSDIVSCR